MTDTALNLFAKIQQMLIQATRKDRFRVHRMGDVMMLLFNEFRRIHAGQSPERKH